jgi:superfamily II DNA or RNA helicase
MKLFDHQQNVMDNLHTLGDPARALLFFKTGAGKTRTALLAVQKLGYDMAMVITPPATYDGWEAEAAKLGMSVQCMSHAKYRQKSTKLTRATPVIADEFHLFGGHKGQGWKKLDAMSRGLQAPLLLLSATPNYNDIERCYCIMHILDPMGTKGGYLQFLYTHCETEQNPFGTEPIVTGFKHYAGAAEFLAAQRKVFYLKDDAQYNIIDLPFLVPLPPAFTQFSYDARRGRIMASIMEQRHARMRYRLLTDDGDLRPSIASMLSTTQREGPMLVFSASSNVAMAIAARFPAAEVVTGGTSEAKKKEIIDRFRAGQLDMLIGTATLATGTDGLDKVCNTLFIVNDTDDDALRRQLIGRILPRGDSASTTAKQIFRLDPGS